MSSALQRPFRLGLNELSESVYVRLIVGFIGFCSNSCLKFESLYNTTNYFIFVSFGTPGAPVCIILFDTLQDMW